MLPYVGVLISSLANKLMLVSKVRAEKGILVDRFLGRFALLRDQANFQQTDLL